jgi:hypothetical protein
MSVPCVDQFSNHEDMHSLHSDHGSCDSLVRAGVYTFGRNL